MLEERRRLLPDASSIMLLAPLQISSFLDFYDKRIASIRKEYVLVPNSNLVRSTTQTKIISLFSSHHSQFINLARTAFN